MRTEDDPMSDDDATSTSSETDGVIEKRTEHFVAARVGVVGGAGRLPQRPR